MRMVKHALAGIILTSATLLAQAQPVDVVAIEKAIAQSIEKNRFPGLSVGRSRLGEEFNALLTPERVQAAAVSLSPLGKPKSIEIMSTNDRGGMERSVILFKFDSMNAEAEMYRTPDGVVQQFLVSRK